MSGRFGYVSLSGTHRRDASNRRIIECTVVNWRVFLVVGYADQHFACTSPPMPVIRREADVIDAAIALAGPLRLHVGRGL